jgi:hypothetical protein
VVLCIGLAERNQWRKLWSALQYSKGDQYCTKVHGNDKEQSAIIDFWWEIEEIIKTSVHLKMQSRQFKVIVHKKPMTLFELLHVILDHDIKKDSEAWQAWDTLLKKIPKTGITTLWSAPTALLVGKQGGPKYGDLCRTWGYRFDRKRKVVDSDLDEMSTGLKETTTRKPKSARGNRKPTPKSVAAATGEEESSDKQDEDEAYSSSPPAESSPGQSQNVNANSSAPRDEDEDEDDAVSKLGMKRKPPDVGAGTGPLTFDSLVASVPRSAWDTPGDMNSTRAALRESANIHVQKALFALALSCQDLMQCFMEW